MKRIKLFAVCVGLLMLAVGCRSDRSSGDPVSLQGTKVALAHAKGFDITHYGRFTEVTVFNPWKKGEVLDRYYLVKNDTVSVPDNGRKIQIPVSSLMANSSTYFGFLEMLGELDKVTGVGKGQYIYNPTILKGIEEGKIKELGESFNLDIERLMMLRPQVVMTTAYNAEDENTKRMRQSGLNIVFNVEWMEPSVLGRAEWIKFMAAFFDKEALADSLFRGIDENYQSLKRSMEPCKELPQIFSGQDYRGTWSMAGGKSYTAELFRDARASYYYASDTTATSISGTIEEAMMRFGKADLWIGVQASSRDELLQMNPKYAVFKAFKEGNVWNINKRSNAAGGNDYWESGVARPDLLLKDMIKICHPDSLPEYGLTYYERLK